MIDPCGSAVRQIQADPAMVDSTGFSASPVLNRAAPLCLHAEPWACSFMLFLQLHSCHIVLTFQHYSTSVPWLCASLCCVRSSVAWHCIANMNRWYNPHTHTDEVVIAGNTVTDTTHLNCDPDNLAQVPSRQSPHPHSSAWSTALLVAMYCRLPAFTSSQASLLMGP